jgi:2-phospho-L-lactate guanylyltransferase (CobY/MobA/RfbA family)
LRDPEQRLSRREPRHEDSSHGAASHETHGAKELRTTWWSPRVDVDAGEDLLEAEVA